MWLRTLIILAGLAGYVQSGILRGLGLVTISKSRSHDRRRSVCLTELPRGGAWEDPTGSRPMANDEEEDWEEDDENSSNGDGDDDDDDDEDEGLNESSDADSDEERSARLAQKWTKRAFSYAQRGRLEAAAEAFERAVNLTPNDAPYRAALLINAGSFLAFSGKPREALQPLREALTLAPDEPRALHALGNALHQCDASHEALHVYARALDKAPNTEFPPNAPLLNNVATILLAKGERTLARATLQKSLAIEPSAPGTLFNLAMATYSEACDAAAIRVLSERGSYKKRRLVKTKDSELELRVKPSSASRTCLRTDTEAIRAMLQVIDLLDRAEPHAPSGSSLRERILALRGVAAARVPGRESDARRDLVDVLRHGAEHGRDAHRRASAYLELASVERNRDQVIAFLQKAIALLQESAQDEIDETETNEENPSVSVTETSSSIAASDLLPQKKQSEPIRTHEAIPSPDLSPATSTQVQPSLSSKEDPSSKKFKRPFLLGGKNRISSTSSSSQKTADQLQHVLFRKRTKSDATAALRAVARADLAAAYCDRNDCALALDSYAAAAHDGLRGVRAFLESEAAPKLKRHDKAMFENLTQQIAQNDAVAALNAFVNALSPEPLEAQLLPPKSWRR